MAIKFSKQRFNHLIFFLILTLTIFSFWAAFALLVVNESLYDDLPGYTVGELCIWELVALTVSMLIAWWMTKTWGTIEIRSLDQKSKLILSKNYGIYFTVYFMIAIIIGIWQWLKYWQ